MKNLTIRSLTDAIALTGLLVTTVQAQTVKHASSIKELEAIITLDEFVVVDVYATWCGPCEAMTPALNKIAADYPNVVIVKVNLDSINKSALNKFVGQTVQSIPLLVFFKDGKQVTVTKVKQDKNGKQTTIESPFIVQGQQSLAQLKSHIKNKFDVA